MLGNSTVFQPWKNRGNSGETNTRGTQKQKRWCEHFLSRWKYWSFNDVRLEEWGRGDLQGRCSFFAQYIGTSLEGLQVKAVRRNLAYLRNLLPCFSARVEWMTQGRSFYCKKWASIHMYFNLSPKKHFTTPTNWVKSPSMYSGMGALNSFTTRTQILNKSDAWWKRLKYRQLFLQKKMGKKFV